MKFMETTRLSSIENLDCDDKVGPIPHYQKG